MTRQPLVVLAVAIEHGHCTLGHAGEQAGLLVGDRLFRAHEADMRRSDIGHDADMGLDLAGQRLDLAGMVHADLEHAVARFARQAGQADGHADMVVERGRAGRGRRLGRQHGAQRILGAGLADRAGDAGDARLAAPAGSAAETFQRLHGVGHADQRAAGILDIARHDGGRGAALHRLGHEAVAVGRLALQGKEQVALADGAAVEGDAIGLERRGDGRAERVRHFVGGPQRAHDTASANSRATSASSK